MKEKIKAYFETSIRTKQQVLQESVETIEKMADALYLSLNKGGKLLAMGNGGSAADAQHMVAELVGRYRTERRALPAIALTPNSSTVTAIANDYGYEQIFARQVEAFCTSQDIVLGISTSGRSANVLKGIEMAKKCGAVTLAFTGLPGKPLADLADYSLIVPAKETSFVQECHICVIHILCGLVESRFS